MDTKVAVIQQNTNLNRWEVVVDGKVELHTKTLAWVQSNIRKSTKMKKLNVTSYVIKTNFGEVVWNPEEPTKRGRKPKAQAKQPEVATETAPVQEVEQVRVVGLEKLVGSEKIGRLVSRTNSTTVVEFDTKEGGIMQYEFDTSSGEQRTENPFHKWKIAS